jgi:hypothetical protein
MANIAPPDIAGAGQTRILVKALEDGLTDLKTDVRDIKNYRFTDLRAFAAGFVLLAGMMIYAYFKIEERSQNLSTAMTRIETKFEDLLARVPPVQTPIPRK